jgi:flagellin
MTSINSNLGALLAQRYLRSNAADAAANQTRVASGQRVASVADDGASFAVGASLRADAASYAAAASAMRGAAAAGMVAISAGESISARLGDIRAKIVQLADGSLSAQNRATLNADLSAMVAGANQQLSGAGFNGMNLLSGGSSDRAVPTGPDAAPTTVRGNDVQPLALAPVNNASDAVNALQDLDEFRRSLDRALSNLGSDVSRLRTQTESAQQAGEATQIGLGALVDADLARESASLASLQVRQQLTNRSVGIANQSPSALLNLLR